MHKLFYACMAVALFQCPAHAEQSAWEKNVRTAEQTFWSAYNHCNFEIMAAQLDANVEFYHDIGGVTRGRDTLITSIKTGICGHPESHIRRAALAETTHVFRLRDHGKIYGAVVQGEHLFYVMNNGTPERLTGHARYTHVWLLDGGKWHLTRVVSFDHSEVGREERFAKLSAALALASPYGSVPFFLRGTMNQWGLTQPMQSAGDHIWTTSVNLTKGLHEFKFGSEDFQRIDLGAPDGQEAIALDRETRSVPLGENFEIDVANTATYQFFLDTNNPGNPSVRVEIRK